MELCHPRTDEVCKVSVSHPDRFRMRSRLKDDLFILAE